MQKIIYILITLMLITWPSSAQQRKTTQTKQSTTTQKKSTATTKKANTTTKKTKTTTKKASTAKGNTTKKKSQPTNNSIKGLRNEQAKVKQNIKKQEQALRNNKARVRQKLKDLERISSDMTLRQRSIDSINTDLGKLDNNLMLLESQLNNMEKELGERKKSYVKSMRYMARQHNIQSKLLFIFSAKSLAETYRRMRFVKQYAAFQRAQGMALQEKQKEVNLKKEQLNAARDEKRTLLSKGQREKDALEQKKTEQQTLVTSLQKEQKTIQSVIDEQKKRDVELNSQIDRLVAEEVEKARQRAIEEAKRKAEQAEAARKKAAELARKKAEAEARERENQRRIAEAKAAEEKAKAAARAAANDKARRERAEQKAREAEARREAAERKAAADKQRQEKEIAAAKRESDNAERLSSVDRAASGAFESNKGRLPSPLPGGRIVSHFGQHSVEGLPGVVLDNKGINLHSSPGASAVSIYDGEVSAVFNAGGSWGVIVRHGAYLSVYCNLRHVSVTKGQKLSTRQTIGTVGNDGILQFQLRKERAKLNPEAWIR